MTTFCGTFSLKYQKEQYYHSERHQALMKPIVCSQSCVNALMTNRNFPE